MKILHISHSDLNGVLIMPLINPQIIIRKWYQHNIFVLRQIFKGRRCNHKTWKFFQQRILPNELGFERRITKYLLSDRLRSYSTGLFGSNLIDKINEINPDIVNLHWINLSTLSISEISRIKQKIVWTIHDMLILCNRALYVKRRLY